MNNKIQIGDYVRAIAPNCPIHFGKVVGPAIYVDTGISDDMLFIDVPYTLIFGDGLPCRLDFHKDDCFKITPQEYFKQVLSRN